MAARASRGAIGYPVAPTNPRAARGGLARRRGRAGLWFVMPWIVGFLLWYVIPMVASLWFSFTDFDLVSDRPTEFIGVDNWQRLFTDPVVRQSAMVTMKFGAIALPVAVLFPMALAYLLVSKSLKARETFRALFFMPSIIPFVAAVLIFGGIMNGQIGWVNEILGAVGIEGPSWFLDRTWVYPSLVFIGLWGVGNAMIIFIAAMNAVPSSLYDAAKIDGASEWQLFRHVTFPVITPIVFYNVIIALIATFQYFTQAYVISNGRGDPDRATLFFNLNLFREAFTFFNMGYASALAWLLFVIVLGLTVLLFKTAGSWVFEGSER